MTINIFKGGASWAEMAKSLEPQMNETGVAMIWADADVVSTTATSLGGELCLN